MDVLVASWAVEAVICELDVTYSLSGTPIYLFCSLLITLRCVSERPAWHPVSRRFPTLAACLGFLPGLGQEMQWLPRTQKLPALLSGVSIARLLSLATNMEVITDFCFGVADLLGIKSKLSVTESTTFFASIGQITISFCSPNSVSLRPKRTIKKSSWQPTTFLWFTVTSNRNVFSLFVFWSYNGRSHSSKTRHKNVLQLAF